MIPESGEWSRLEYKLGVGQIKVIFEAMKLAEGSRTHLTIGCVNQ